MQTRSEYYSQYRAAQNASGVSFVPESPLIYDSVWTLALALNNTLANQILASNSCSSGLSLYANLGSELREAASRTSFIGASVSQFFLELRCILVCLCMLLVCVLYLIVAPCVKNCFIIIVTRVKLFLIRMVLEGKCLLKCFSTGMVRIQFGS